MQALQTADVVRQAKYQLDSTDLAYESDETTELVPRRVNISIGHESSSLSLLLSFDELPSSVFASQVNQKW